MSQEDNNIRIQSIKVEQLFGLYDHGVDLKNDRVTVIHGPNGVGKTVFLKLTNAFLKGSYYEISRVPFDVFEIIFRDGSIAKVKQEKTANSVKLHVSLQTEGGKEHISTLEGDSLNIKKLASQIADTVPYITQIGPESWMDRRSEEILGIDDLLLLADDYTPQNSKRLSVKEPKGLRELRSRINVHFIEAQRLIRISSSPDEWRKYRSTEHPTRNTVQEYSKDLKRRIESALATYAKHSQKLDQTFPQRLLQGNAGGLTIEQLKKQLYEVEESRKRLKNIGILDGGDSGQDPYPLQTSDLTALQQAQLSVMSVYASDTKSKLKILEELSERAEILLTVINRKFTNKRVCLSRESGLRIVGKDGKTIPVTSLSSGEQHELVLLYDLLFKVNPNTLVLIDEPELSLHIHWQKGFMEDLLEIIRLAQFDVLMATHSPYIVGDRSDLLVILSAESNS